VVWEPGSDLRQAQNRPSLFPRRDGVQASTSPSRPCSAISHQSAPSGDPLAELAKEELVRIIRAMRGEHGPKLRDIPGRVLYGTADKPLDEHGKLCAAPKRAPGTPFPLSRRTEAALVRLGWGCKTTGIALIAESPIVSGGTAEDGEYQTSRLRAPTNNGSIHTRFGRILGTDLAFPQVSSSRAWPVRRWSPALSHRLRSPLQCATLSSRKAFRCCPPAKGHRHRRLPCCLL
jgi:hypothetical protein